MLHKNWAVAAISILGFMMTSAARAECLELDALVIAQVFEARPDSPGLCSVTLNFYIPQGTFDANIQCPLEFDAVAGSPVHIRMGDRATDCSELVDKVVSGRLYRSTQNGDEKTYLE